MISRFASNQTKSRFPIFMFSPQALLPKLTTFFLPPRQKPAIHIYPSPKSLAGSTGTNTVSSVAFYRFSTGKRESYSWVGNNPYQRYHFLGYWRSSHSVEQWHNHVLIVFHDTILCSSARCCIKNAVSRRCLQKKNTVSDLLARFRLCSFHAREIYSQKLEMVRFFTVGSK